MTKKHKNIVKARKNSLNFTSNPFIITLGRNLIFVNLRNNGGQQNDKNVGN